jgi:hypothetical protein
MRSARLDFFRGGCSSFSVDIHRNDLGAVLREEQRNGFSNAHCGTGDECNAALQAHDFSSDGETITSVNPRSTKDGTL